MKNTYYSVTIALSLFIIVSCSTESTPIYQLTTTVEPTEAGTVSPASSEYEEGEQVNITASPNEHWVFDSWQGGQTGSTNPATVTMDSDKSITALFIKRDYPLTVNTEGEGTVSEEIVQAKTTDYPHGTTIELTANPADGWEFVDWSGDLSSSENPETITVEEEKSVTASFAEIFYTVDISLDGEGTVNETLIEGEKSEHGYTYGSKIEIEIDGGENYFIHWEGDLEGTDNPKTITILNDITAKAVLDDNPFAGGNGSELYPYQISSVEQLQHIGKEKYLDKFFVQVNNINAEITSDWNNKKGFRPIGSDNSRFIGSFDGADFNILNLFIDRIDEYNIGLFGVIEDAIIKNVTLIDINVTGDRYTGALVGINEGNIIKSTASGEVAGNIFIGGLIGSNRGSVINSNALTNVSGEQNYIGGFTGTNVLEGEISNSKANGNVSGSSFVGGFVGANTQSVINNSLASGNINGRQYVGGFAGENTIRSTINNSSAEGNVSGIGEQVGGFSGRNSQSQINESYATGLVTSEGNLVGGFVGDNTRSEINKSFATGKVSSSGNQVGGFVGRNTLSGINNSYSNGSVVGNIMVGGLVGENTSDGIITTSYTISEVEGSESKGGFIGKNEADIETSYWNIETTAQDEGIGDGSSDGITGLTKSEMTDTAAEDNMNGFNFVTIWQKTTNYPSLRWEFE